LPLSISETVDFEPSIGERRAQFVLTPALLNSLSYHFYTGYTKDLKLQFDQHKKGQVESTKARLPLKLIYYEG
jgi:putative endonuclease